MRVLRRSRQRLISISLRRCLTIPLRTLAAFKAAVLSVFSALTRALRTLAAFKAAVLSVFSALTQALRALAAFKAAIHTALRAVPVPVFADVVYGIADAHRFALLTDCHDIVLSAL